MMTPDDRWRRVKALFELALEQMPPSVDVWLDQQGETDEDVRADVLSLLTHQKQSGSFLNTPIADRASDLISESHPLQEGQVVDKYTIVRELGRGGMGRVYLATEPSLKRQVALKTLAPELAANPEYRERFIREARAATALEHHSGICTVYSYGEVDGTPYIAHEFVDGRTLREEIEEGPLPALEAIRQTSISLADTLAFAHQHGITHRDFKPENIMRATAGRLKVLDFGLASVTPPAGGLASIAQSLSIPGGLMGTLMYMAPEQLDGKKADHRSDVFAFGVVLYEYACGVHPFASAQPMGIMANILKSDPTPASRHRADLPASLTAIITRCLCKKPEDRFPSAVELTAALNNEASKPRQVTAPAGDHMVGWWRTHQLAVIALYLTACVLAWQVKEWQPGIARALFMVSCIAATIGGVLRSHLLFTERVTTTQLTQERERWTYPLTAADLVIALVLLADGAILYFGDRLVPAVLTVALGLGIAAGRVVIERVTTAATFPHPD